MEAVEADSDWQLVDPHTKEVKKTLKAKDLWKEIFKERKENGEPFLHFIDASNRALPEPLRALGLRVNNSNLCTEITLPTSQDRTAVCCLSSVNVEKFDEWSLKPEFIEDMYRMLDNALTVFIEEAPEYMRKAVYSAVSERSVGLGVMGLHAYYQCKGVAVESPMATGMNKRIFSHIKEKSDEANLILGYERGSPGDMAGTGLRFAHCTAIAPNASSSIFLDTSPGIEPFAANYFVQKTLSGSHAVKNRYLDNILRTVYALEGGVLEDTWTSIAINSGSVQHLDFMEQYHKDIFKTAEEVDQVWLVEQAAGRQPYIDQAQSLNLFVPEVVKASYIHNLHMLAWKRGLKSLYYLRSSAATRASEIKTIEDSACVACEG